MAEAWERRFKEVSLLFGEDGARKIRSARVAVVGLGDHEFAPWLPSPLTTFAFDIDAFTEAVAVRTLDLIAGRPVDSIKVSGHLVVRQSCGAGLRGALRLGNAADL